MIRPIPEQYGVGFCSHERLPQYAGQYREEQAGRIWNYFVTPQCQVWPESGPSMIAPLRIDGFSPNLNKHLHIGHLRQLALAKSLSAMLRNASPATTFVSLLGASQGVYKYATDELKGWFDFLQFNPTLYYDVLMPKDQEVVPRRTTQKVMKFYDNMFQDENFQKKEDCEVWDGPKGEVIVVRNDGRSTYAFHDIAFAKTVAPTHYITGAEQKDHFESLGLGDKHLPMGLVLGADGKKIKSRTGDSLTAAEALEQIQANLDETPHPKELAWNVLAWNFLHVARNQNVKYSPEEWTKVDAPGMYITYTLARMRSALKSSDKEMNALWMPPHERKVIHHKEASDKFRYTDENASLDWDTFAKKFDAVFPDPQFDMTQADADLVGFANQIRYYHARCLERFDPAMMANYAHDLARKLGVAYHAEKIQGGRYGFKYAMYHATSTLRECMWHLGMFDLSEV